MSEPSIRGVWLRYAGRSIEVPEGAFVIGKGKECHLSIDDSLIARRHARLVRAAVLTLEELGSHVGVYLNGRRVRRVRVLRDGDVIVLGSQRITVTIAPDAFAQRARERHGRKWPSD